MADANFVQSSQREQRAPLEAPKAVALGAVFPPRVAGRENDPPMSESVAAFSDAMAYVEKYDENHERHYPRRVRLQRLEVQP